MAIKAATTFSLKDQLFNPESLRTLSDALDKTELRYNRKQFEKEILDEFPHLELKARIDWMVTVLANYLPDEFETAIVILEEALPSPLDPKKTDDDFGEFIWAVPGEYIARFGCTDQRLEKSLSFLRKSTMRFTAENSIRPFLRQYPEKTMKFIRRCATDKNYHVRRLASEGIRPFLPWAVRANVAPDKIFEVLEVLKQDSTRYVTRSVANTLNDLSKIDPQKVVDTLANWQRQPSNEMTWVTRHALRTLIKQDHGGALSLLGYSTEPDFKLSRVSAPRSVAVGDNFNYRCTITSNADQSLRIALRVHYLKANGSHSVKVFAVKDTNTSLGETIEIDKKISFKPITTRTMYLGQHHVEIVVNGIAQGKKSFELR
ncbi:MAG: DNA alkylation repair protein [Oceanicoccus sp.]